MSDKELYELVRKSVYLTEAKLKALENYYIDKNSNRSQLVDYALSSIISTYEYIVNPVQRFTRDMSIVALKSINRVYTACMYSGIKTIGDLYDSIIKGERIRGVGARGIDNIKKEIISVNGSFDLSELDSLCASLDSLVKDIRSLQISYVNGLVGEEEVRLGVRGLLSGF